MRNIKYLLFVIMSLNFRIIEVFFFQMFNAIKKIRESSSTSPVAETEGTIMEEVVKRS